MAGMEVRYYNSLQHLWPIFTCLILGLRPANERRRYKVTPSLIGWAQTKNQPCFTREVDHSFAKPPLKLNGTLTGLTSLVK